MDPVEVFVADEQAEVAVDALRWVHLARMVLEEQGVRGDAELSMLFVDEKSMGDLNERFLGREGPTDVLAFPMDDELIESGRQPDQGGRGPGSPAEPYFSLGYPRKAYGKINWHVGYRLANHLKHHRSQRPYKLPEGMSYYEHFQRLGLKFLRITACDSR